MTGLGGWRRKAMFATLGLAGFLDLLVTAGGGGPAWSLLQLPIMFMISGVAVTGLCRGGDHLYDATGLAAGMSLILTISLVLISLPVDVFGGFGFAEGTAMTLVLIVCWRRAASPRQRLITGAAALAVMMLPLRLGWTAETVTIETFALMVTALAAATGSTLRATDASHHDAVTLIRRTERQDVARELHDVVAHHVTGMVVLTQAARTVARHPSGPATPEAGKSSSASSTPGLDDSLAAIERAGGEALLSLRAMVAVLRSDDPAEADPSLLEPTPTLKTLEDVVRRFRDSGTVAKVDLDVAPATRDLPPHVQAAMHRVVQECLTNVSRYARGARVVSIDLTCADGMVVLRVTDSGGRAEEVPPIGVTAALGGGFGIIGMRERMSALGGRLSAGPDTEGRSETQGQGWTVRAEVPR